MFKVTFLLHNHACFISARFKWTDLGQGIPFTHSNKLIQINKKEIVIYKDKIFYKYDLMTGDLTEWIKPDFKDANMGSVSICYDDTNKRIFVLFDAYAQFYWPQTTRLAVIDTETKKMDLIINEISKSDFSHTFNPSAIQLIYIDEHLHAISGTEHFILKNEDKECKFELVEKLLTSFGDSYSDFGFSTLAMRSQHKIFVLGGRTYHYLSTHNSILCYNIRNNSWSELSIKLPKKLSSFTCSVSFDERYIILIGGADKQYKYSRDIYVMDLLLMKFMKCTLDTPEHEKTMGYFRSVIARDEMQENYVVFGYVRDCFKNDQAFASLRFPPDYIIRLILSWYIREYVHMFHLHTTKLSSHWMISLDEMLNNLTEIEPIQELGDP